MRRVGMSENMVPCEVKWDLVDTDTGRMYRMYVIGPDHKTITFFLVGAPLMERGRDELAVELLALAAKHMNGSVQYVRGTDGGTIQ